MWLCIISGMKFEDTFESTQQGKVKQMQPMWLCMHRSKCFDETFENTHWGKAKQLQPVLLYILWGQQLEEAFENAHWRNQKNCIKCDRNTSENSDLRYHKRATLGENLTNAFLGLISPTISPQTCISKVVINISNVVSVTSCHLWRVIWRSTCLFTQERNLLSVSNVIAVTLKFINIWNSIKRWKIQSISQANSCS